MNSPTNSLSNSQPTTSKVTVSMVVMPLLKQTGKVFIGPSARNEANSIGLGLSTLNKQQRKDLERAKNFALGQSVRHRMLNRQISHQHHTQKISMYAHALSLMSKVYVGNVSFETRELNLREAFGVFGPIKHIHLSYDNVTGQHRGFAFVEYEFAEAAKLSAESMNGVFMTGRNLKVTPMCTEPSFSNPTDASFSYAIGNYDHSQSLWERSRLQAQPVIELIKQDSKKYHRIYLASIHSNLTEDDLKSIFKEFGEIVKCHFPKQPNGSGGHRGFGYIEFTTQNAVEEALKLNKLDLSGQTLYIGTCITPPGAYKFITAPIASNISTATPLSAGAMIDRIKEEALAEWKVRTVNSYD